jgi:exodeoxyribonuclease V alpha subunit
MGATPCPTEPTPTVCAFFEALEARTVHRLLRVDPRMPGRFKHGPDHPLPVDLVLIDETSMLDLTLMTRLVEAVPPAARLVLLGDHHQLASVDAGCVLADLCRAARFDAPRLGPEARHDLEQHAGLSIGADIDPAPSAGLHDCGIQLVTSRRFTHDSGVGAVARAILTGDGPGSRSVLLEGAHQDTQWQQLGPDSTATREFAQLILDGYAPMLRRLLDGTSRDDASFHRQLLDGFDQFRLLCAHRRGRLGVQGLVTLTESLLGRSLRGFKPRGPTYIGRPVLITRNDYSVRRYNGDVGLIVERDGQPVAVFPDAANGVAYLSPARLPPHETVFAMTIHKSQGSEFDHAAVVLPSRPGPILTRELIYTGITRAKKRLTVVGTAEVWDQGIEREVARASGLSDRLGASLR